MARPMMAGNGNQAGPCEGRVRAAKSKMTEEGLVDRPTRLRAGVAGGF